MIAFIEKYWFLSIEMHGKSPQIWNWTTVSIVHFENKNRTLLLSIFSSPVQMLATYSLSIVVCFLLLFALICHQIHWVTSFYIVNETHRRHLDTHLAYTLLSVSNTNTSVAVNAVVNNDGARRCCCVSSIAGASSRKKMQHRSFYF